ncbi:MAG TPA: HAD family hydrolase [Hyphomicrobiaceae bacterium]|nr:HAD family hydrolase [Hyphomicrobiaceae bacterium]
MAIRGILFDKDGTIVDYWRTWVPVNREAALYAANGDAALAQELLRLGGHDPETDRITPGSPFAAGDFMDLAQAFAAHPGVASATELVDGIARTFVAGGATRSVLIPGAHAAIAELHRRGLRLGIATNDCVAGIEASLAQHGILGHFDFAAGCDSGYGAKPDPRMALAFCGAVDLGRQEVAVVGDAVHDLAMGRAAGVGLTVGVLSGTSAREDLAATADLIVADIGELPARPEFRAG